MSNLPGHVLVVDDVVVFRQVVCRALELDGIKTSVASTGNEAFKMITETPPRLIILDLVMPGMDGWELLRTLRSDPARARIPIIILSATTDEDVAERALALGAVKVFFKTKFSIRELRQVVKRFLSDQEASSG
jgi:CheY-like chemotaxis protein